MQALRPQPGPAGSECASYQVVRVICLGVGVWEASLSATAHGSSGRQEKRLERQAGTISILPPGYFHVQVVNWNLIFAYSFFSFEVKLIYHKIFMLTYPLSFNKYIYQWNQTDQDIKHYQQLESFPVLLPIHPAPDILVSFFPSTDYFASFRISYI